MFEGDRTDGVNLLATERTATARRGRQMFNDFQVAQTENLKKWARDQESIGGVSEIFKSEAPRLSMIYSIVEAVACGVSAVVCKGVEQNSEKLVAVKFVRIHIDGLSEATRKADCREEARLQKLCQHPNIVELLDFEMGDTFAIYVMEFIPCSLLEKIVEFNSFVEYSERVAGGYIRDIASALALCHSKAVIHCDVKLDNLLVDDSGKLKLCDFGVAEQMRYRSGSIQRSVATPLIAAPEIYSHGHCKPAADMWSLGVCLYILLCGYPPFKEKDIRKRIVQARYHFVELDWSPVSIMGRDLVSRLLVLNENNRLTAHQVLEHPWVKATSGWTNVPRRVTLLTAIHGHSDASSSECIEGSISQEGKATAKADLSSKYGDSEYIDEQNAPEKKDVEKSETDKANVAALSTGKQAQTVPFVPLPHRVTRFLRNMHHYRELEKAGFENVPGGRLYRRILDGVDEITSDIITAACDSDDSQAVPTANDQQTDRPARNCTTFCSTGRRKNTYALLWWRIHEKLQHAIEERFQEGVEEIKNSKAAGKRGTLANIITSYYPDAENFAWCESPPHARTVTTEASSSINSTLNLSQHSANASNLDIAQTLEQSNDSPDSIGDAEKSRKGMVSDTAEVNDAADKMRSLTFSICGSDPGESTKSTKAFNMDYPPSPGVSVATFVSESTDTTSESMVLKSGASPGRFETISTSGRYRFTQSNRKKSVAIQPERELDWIDDLEAISCRICDSLFTIFVRRHHCRSCGGVFCGSCTKSRIPIRHFDTCKRVRVCKLCASQIE